AVERAIDLGKQLEDARQRFPRDSHAGVTHAEHDFAPVLRHGQRNLPPWVGVFRGIVDEVGQNLREAREVRLHMQRLAWKQQRERVLICIDKWPARLRGGGDDLGDVDRLELEVDLALGDARYVEQIVDQAHELLQLT